ncbi:hypothetical protein HPP92_028094 [Vanilla planifolia]|uniref:Uncharacterized protein n=1 Tax=Vanilla planifolia TaxID=51239 RepID=A0A835U3A1_VANPL|nr:hypothetical protein HPP92_028094 [Vanilla planifolia]
MGKFMDAIVVEDENTGKGASRELQMKESEISEKVSGLEKKIHYAKRKRLEYEQKRNMESPIGKLRASLESLENELKEIQKKEHDTKLAAGQLQGLYGRVEC